MLTYMYAYINAYFLHVHTYIHTLYMYIYTYIHSQSKAMILHPVWGNITMGKDFGTNCTQACPTIEAVSYA